MLVHVFLGFQDVFSSEIEHIVLLHDWAVLVLLGVMSLVLYLAIYMWCVRLSFGKFYSNESLEVMWTIVPVLVLFCLSMVSLRTLYLLEEVVDPAITVNVSGHQWYWSYDCDMFSEDEYDSYIVSCGDLGVSGYRLLEVDKSLVLPVGVEVRLLFVSEDVIHSWAVPSLGLKIDCIPGRLNQSVVMVVRPGVIYGQCSEICGAYHSFIPIKVESMFY